MKKQKLDETDFEVIIRDGCSKIFKSRGNEKKVMKETNVFLELKGLWNGKPKRRKKK